MKRLPAVSFAVLLLTAAAARADPATPAAVLTGQSGSTTKVATVNGDTTVTLQLVLDKDTTVEVLSKDVGVLKAINDALDARLKDFEKRSKEVLKQIEEAAKKSDLEKVKKLNEELNKLGDNLSSVPAVAEGVLSYTDKTWRLTGTMRPFDPAGKDKDAKLGACTLQGEAVAGDFKAGDTKSKLALKCGDLTVLLTGPAAKETVKGGVRATGTLRLTKGGEAVLEATKIDAVKK